jgi:signal transduction histidine kinase/DNA-binding response OmpR family regulator
VLNDSRPKTVEWLVGGGELGARIRALDWSRTPLGPLEGWPQSLRSAVSLLLPSKAQIVLFWGPELVALYNDAYKPVFGRKHPWALGQPARECWREVWDVLQPLFEGVTQTGEAFWARDHLFYLERHGFVEETYFDVSYDPVRDETARVGGVFCIVSETTGRVLSERRLNTLRELSARTETARSIDAVCRGALGAMATDPGDLPYALLYVLDTETRARLIGSYGAKPADAARELDLDAGDEWTMSLARAVRGRTAAEGQPAPWIDGRPESADSRREVILPIRSASAPLGFVIAGVSRFLALEAGYRDFFDLVAEKLSTALSNVGALEEERQRAEMLAELDRAKSAFFSNVSHEFRTPLTLMIGPTEDALGSPNRTLSGDGLQTLYRNELRLLKLVNALLDFSRIEAGRMRASYAATDLSRLTMELASVFRSAVERAGLEYVVTCDPLSEPVYVDREMWEKTVLNLVSNALKFTFEGRIEVSVRDEGSSVVLTVRDTGIGIAPEEIPRIFDRFHQVKGARARTQEGSGIGLALVNDLVRLNGGTIAVDSAVGRGTIFTVRLPKGTAHIPTAGIESPPPDSDAIVRRTAFVEEALRWMPGVDAAGVAPEEGPPVENVSLPVAMQTVPGRVLIADDNADMRAYLTRLLRPHWEVEAVGDGAAGLAAARERPPDLILTDVMMPGLDGFELLRALRADPRTSRVPVVMLSARAGEEARIEGLQSGADEYLAKPFSARELIARVNSQIALARHARERESLLEREQVARREAELQKQHLHALFMQAPTLVLILRGPDFVIELANDLVCQVWGRRHEDVIDRPLLDALPELRGQVFEDLLRDVYRSGTPYVGRGTPARLDRRGDGTFDTVYFNFVYAPFRNVGGGIEGVFVTASDVTDDIRAHDQVDQLRQAAEAANRAKDEFLAMLGHELRNPLAPIQTALQLMRLRGDGTAERERMVIERQVAHLTRLVDDLLDVSRIARGRVDLERKRIEIAEVVARAVEIASPLLEQRTHTLDVQVPRHGLMVDGDPSRLSQVVSNLLTNAAKYTESGGRITVHAGREHDDIVLRVRDTGIGISPEMVPHVFDLFVQERQALDRSQGGLGLGLTIVRSLVALHHGTVSVKSEGPGRGSEFTIRLPVAPAAEAAASPASAGTSEARASNANGLRVLVVDDNEDAADMLVHALRSKGHHARMANDGPAAIRICEEFRPSVAVLDIGLPVMDGYELAGRLREVPGMAHLRLIAVTGYGQEADQQRTRAAGFDCHLVKPIDIEALEGVLAG